MTETLFRDDAYLRTLVTKVTMVNERGGIITDKTILYPTSGGQPGDQGLLTRSNGQQIKIATTIYDIDKTQIIHVPADQDNLPETGEDITLTVDWDTRYRHMRVHSLMHLLCASVPFPVTGGQIAADGGRLDFDVANPEMLDKQQLNDKLNQLITENHPVSSRWISDEELEAKPELVRTMSVKPPRGTGKVRLIAIGVNEQVDLQPCGGTHIAHTGEIGPVVVAKVENKGKQNRRIRVNLL